MGSTTFTIFAHGFLIAPPAAELGLDDHSGRELSLDLAP